MKRIFLVGLTLINLLSISAYQWPCNRDYLSSIFGNISNGNVEDGIRFTNDGQAIYPLATGEVIFYQDEFNFGDTTFHSDAGNMLVLKHVGEFKSYYSNFHSDMNFSLMDSVNKSEMLGTSSSDFDKFKFSVFDERRKLYINPQQILPYLNDENRPVISSVVINNLGKEIKLSRNRRVPAGDSSIYINAWDVIKVNERAKKFTPFSVNVFVDGFERYNSSLSAIKEVDGFIYISGDSDIPIGDFISGGNMIFGGDIFLTKGRSLIEIVIKDIDGNEASKSYSVVVE